VSRRLLLGASAVLALSILVLPWYELDDYVTNGWDATWVLRGVLLLALVNVVLARVGGSPRLAAAVAACALALVVVRVALPPDFGFDFDGLDVPVERRLGCWVGLGTAVLAAFGAVLEARGRSMAVKGQEIGART
jgi:hypothetical protein